MLKIINEVYYNMLINSIKDYGDGLKANPSELDLEFARNVGVVTMLFMLSAKHYGYETCLMHVHKVETLRKEFNILEHLMPLMMITIGKSVDKQRPRGYRKFVEEFVHFNRYK